MCGHRASVNGTRCAKTAIHQVITILATSKNLLYFQVITSLLTTGRPTDDLTLIIVRVLAMVIIKVSGHQYCWLLGGYYLEIGHF